MSSIRGYYSVNTYSQIEYLCKEGIPSYRKSFVDNSYHMRTVIVYERVLYYHVRDRSVML